MKIMEKTCQCEMYSCDIYIQICKSEKKNNRKFMPKHKIVVWVVVKRIGKIILSLQTLIWGGKECEARKEADKILNQ